MNKTKIISRLFGYHGMTLAATSATGMSKFHTMFGAPLEGFVHVPNPIPYRYDGEFNDGETVAQAAARALEEAILREGPDTVAAFISEPIQGAGGLVIADEGYFDLVQEICKKHEVLLIVDEVICGFGRTGNWFGSDEFGINPDIMQFAKGGDQRLYAARRHSGDRRNPRCGFECASGAKLDARLYLLRVMRRRARSASPISTS